MSYLKYSLQKDILNDIVVTQHLTKSFQHVYIQKAPFNKNSLNFEHQI